MCGIAVCLGTNIEVGRRFCERAGRMLKHRGPDDEGIFADCQITMGHRRLAVVDLSSAAHQPMVSPDKRWVIVYNGEIYNHMEIRQTLCKSWEFQSRSDTETVLAALAINGPESLESMVGMWSLALWDSKKQQLLISRDRYGQKPLYWRRSSDGSLRLASEIRPLMDEGEHPVMYGPAVAEYLATGNYGHLGERTFFRDVYSFPPSHWAMIKPGDKEPLPVRYWRFPVLPKKERRPYDDTVRRQFRDAFAEAVSSQLMSDVPVGATLSGGLDSSAIVGAMVAHRRKAQIPVFTAQASGSAFDESCYVKDVEKRWKGSLRIHWISLEKMPISSLLQETIRIQEEPFGDPSISAHGMLMAAARKAGVSVILGGQGGDELLFGYAYMRDSLLATWMREGRTSAVLNEARALGLKPATLVRMGLAAWLPEVERRVRQHLRQRRRYWLTPMLRNIGQNGLLQLASQGDADMLRLEIVERTTLPHLTHYDDRNGMARSIEGRMPFLDHRLADVVCSVDEQAFLNQGLSKRILREACRDLLPQSVLQRRDKIGFFTPLRDMLKAESQWVLAMLSDDYARSLNLFDVNAINPLLEGVIQTHDSNIDDILRVWRALSVRVWAETFSLVPFSNSDQALN